MLWVMCYATTIRHFIQTEQTHCAVNSFACSETKSIASGWVWFRERIFILRVLVLWVDKWSSAQQIDAFTQLILLKSLEAIRMELLWVCVGLLYSPCTFILSMFTYSSHTPCTPASICFSLPSMKMTMMMLTELLTVDMYIVDRVLDCRAGNSGEWFEPAFRFFFFCSQ